ncbi:MAG: hypothetical protein ACLU3U_12490 [Gallintestinimicrobium sp.]
MKNRKYDLAAFMMAVLVGAAVLFGCGEPSGAVSKEEPLTVYLWENSLIKNLVPYIHEQLPDQDIEFIVGNNDTDLYSYMEEHGELPDVITVRRFSGTDAQDLQPYLMDFASMMLFPGIIPMHCNIIKILTMRFNGCLSVVCRRRSLPIRHCLISMV